MRTAALLVVLLLAGCREPAAPAQPTATPSPTATTSAAPAVCPLPKPRCPIPAVTPGSVIPGQAGICTTSYNPRRELTDAAKRRVLAAYGLPAGQPVAEWDHLVARWAGGTSTSSNVWPQVAGADKARKDRLETVLYEQVCKARTLTLAVARARMREFWRWW